MTLGVPGGYWNEPRFQGCTMIQILHLIAVLLLMVAGSVAASAEGEGLARIRHQHT